MPKTVIMPKFEMAQETGTVSVWLKQNGDPVEKGEPILEIETDKATMEVESPAAGTLAGICANPGQIVPIGQAIAYILQPGESLPSEDIRAQKPTDTPHRTTAVARQMAQKHGVDLQSVSPAAGKRLTRTDVEQHLLFRQQQPASSHAAHKIRAVPAARRLARQMGVALDTVTGSGPQGRIQSKDVRRQMGLAKEPGQPVAESAIYAGAVIGRRTPLSGIRRTIAGRLTDAARNVPQFTISMDVAMARAKQVVSDFQTDSNGPRFTITAFLVRACAWALRRHPLINAGVNMDSHEIIEWADINIGVAVAAAHGLLVPVIHRADRLDARTVAKKLDDLSRRARDGNLRSEEMRGGTFTISNLGMFGVDHFTAIVNPPQAAILAVSQMAKRAVISPDNQVSVQLVADFTLTADHRAVDGAQAAQFLADVKQVVEHPGLLL